ncbi:MAG: hypothetical protein JO346_06930, partial [Alphaproteobacteria bacterium]|nr:hypothetical protein [Alphaproteobacteria bacterium]
MACAAESTSTSTVYDAASTGTSSDTTGSDTGGWQAVPSDTSGSGTTYDAGGANTYGGTAGDPTYFNTNDNTGGTAGQPTYYNTNDSTASGDTPGSNSTAVATATTGATTILNGQVTV